MPLVGGGSLPIDDIRAILNLHHNLDITTSGVVIKGQITGFLESFGEVYINIQNASQVGTPSDGDTMLLRLQSNLMDRDEIEAAIAAAAYTLPTITTFAVLNSEQAPDQWTDIMTGLAANDFVELSFVYEAGDGNWGTDMTRFRFGFLPTSPKTWFPRPADSGARFNLRRNGTTLQAQTAGPLTGQSFELYANKRE